MKLRKKSKSRYSDKKSDCDKNLKIGKSNIKKGSDIKYKSH